MTVEMGELGAFGEWSGPLGSPLTSGPASPVLSCVIFLEKSHRPCPFPGPWCLHMGHSQGQHGSNWVLPKAGMSSSYSPIFFKNALLSGSEVKSQALKSWRQEFKGS